MRENEPGNETDSIFPTSKSCRPNSVQDVCCFMFVFYAYSMSMTWSHKDAQGTYNSVLIGFSWVVTKKMVWCVPHSISSTT